MNSKKAIIFASIGAVIAGVLSAACCLLPVLFAIVGIGSAGLSAFLEPARPYLLAAAYGCIGIAFLLANKKKGGACEPGSICETGSRQRYTKLFLWFLLVVVTLFATFPYWFELFV